MTQPDIIQTILKDSNYHLDLFNAPEIQDLRKKIEGNHEKPIIFCEVSQATVSPTSYTSTHLTINTGTTE